MKKAMISQPVNDLASEQIEVVRDKARTYLESQGYEVVDTLFDFDYEILQKLEIKNIPLYYLATSIEKLAKCDAIFFCNGWKKARRCIIEHDCAKMYGVKMIFE